MELVTKAAAMLRSKGMKKASPILERHQAGGAITSLRARSPASINFTRRDEHVPIATFRAPDKWIRSIVRQSLDFRLPPGISNSGSLDYLDSLLPLIRHDAMDSDDAFVMALERNFSGPQSIADVPCKSTANFYKFARDHAMNPNETRVETISFPCGGSTYMPPSGADVTRAIQTAIESVSKQYLAAVNHSQRLGVALAAYYLILTIHPFSDGNGRTSRFYFACLIRSLKTLNTPILLLALCFLHKNRSVNFYIASQLARSGDFSFFMNSYADSISAAATAFDSELEKLSAWASANDNADLETVKDVLFAIRRKVVLQTF